MDATSLFQAFVLALGTAGLYAAVASGLTLEFGVMRIINFAHGEFVMFGAFITYFLAVSCGVSPAIGMIVAGCAMGILSAAVYYGILSHVLKQNEHNQLLATLGLSIVMVNLAVILWTPNARALHIADILPPLRMGQVVLPGNNVLVALVGLALSVVLTVLKNHTRYGLRMRLVSDDPELAGYTGLNVHHTFALAFVIGGIAAGIAGGLVSLILYVHPMVGTDLVIRAFAIMALAGMGSVPGALVGAVVLALFEQIVSTFVTNGASWGYGVAFLVIVLVLLFKPRGLFGKALRT